MKKLLLVAVALCGLLSTAQNDSASYPTKGDWTIAPQVGANFSTYSDDDFSFDTRTSFNLGVIGDYFFNDRWSFRTGLVLDNMGAEDFNNDTDKLTYLTLPANANWHFGSGRNWYLNFGLTAAFLVDAEGEANDGRTADISDLVKPFDLGINFGIGYRIDVTPEFQLGFDFQGYGGLIPVLDLNDAPDFRNSRSQLNISGVFKL